VLGRRRRGARDDVLRAKPEPAIVDLGSISCPSGELVLVDATYLNMWSGERSPGEINLHIEDEALAAGFAAAIDLDVDGPDAMEAVKAFGRQPWGPFLYDIPEHGVADTRRDFDAMCGSRGLRASLRPVERVSHRERVRRAVSLGGSCIMIMGIPVVAARVEASRELPVVGVRVDFGGASVSNGR